LQPEQFFRQQFDVIESEYCHILNVSLFLQIEEIITKQLIKEDLLIFHSYQCNQQKLQDVRVLLDIAGHSIVLFQKHCQVHGMKIDFEAVNCQHRSCLLESYPFKSLEPYLDKLAALEEVSGFWWYRSGVPNHHMASVEHNTDSTSSDSWCERHQLEYAPIPDELQDNSSTSS
jgi:hypothetical protein